MKKILLSAVFSVALSIGFINAQEAKREEFKPNGKVLGEVFGDYYYMIKGDTLENGVGGYNKKHKGDNGFSIRRFYLGYKYNFSEKFTAKLMFEGNDDNLLTNGKRSVNIKYAYVRWRNIFSGSDLIIGAQSTPTWSRFTEKIWGYRSVEKTILDYWKQGLSNDLGVSLSGNIVSDGTVRYNFMVGNGAAQKPEFDIFKKVYGSVNARLLNKRLLLELYGDYEQQEFSEDKFTVKGFVGFQNDKLTVGIEPFIKQQSQMVGENIKMNGSTFMARGTIIDQKLFGFAKLDVFKNSDNTNEYLEFSVFGIDYQPVKGVHIMPNVWVTNYNFLNNIVIENGTDVVGRVTFWFKF